ncbi:MAG: SDR family oxidoreductase [Bacteroidota bacterium]
MSNSKIAFITGGSRGLGKDTALNLAKAGHNIIFTYNSNLEAAQTVAAEIEGLGQKAAYLQLNVADISTFDSFTNQFKTILQATFGADKFDFLINNAGIGRHAMIGQTDEETFDLLMNIQFKGVYFLTQALLPYINDGGSIVNVSTGLTRFTLPGYAAYASMKGAIEVFTRYLAKELGNRQITANVIAPGAIDNDFNKAAFTHNPQIVDYIASQTALGRVGQSTDIGKVVNFLTSEDAGWVNGQRVEASGGMFL